jgi:DNA-binding transcriptional LysR family regulator
MVGRQLPVILGRFRRDFPEVSLTLVSDSTEKLRGLLQNRELDLVLLAEIGPGHADETLSTDDLVWVGVPKGEAHLRRPLPIAVCNDSRCGIRTVTIETLARAGIAWRAIVHLGNLEPVYDTVEADMAVSTFLERDVPDGLVVLDAHGLPGLPRYHINLRLPVPTEATSCAVQELARYIRQGFAEQSA